LEAEERLDSALQKQTKPNKQETVMKKTKTGMALLTCLTLAWDTSAARIGDVENSKRIQKAEASASGQWIAGFAIGIRNDAGYPELQNAKGDSAPVGYEMLGATKKDKPPKKK
jgi:hypothetical protein